MIISLSWKNVWRNKTRSLVVIFAVLLGLFGGTMAVGIMNGWIAQRLHDAIYKEMSHVQIHNADFMNNEEVHLTINNYDNITSVLDTMKDVVAYTSCVKVFAMMQTDWAATGGIIKGIDPEREKTVSEVYQTIIDGDYFAENGRIPSIVIGSKMAENLKLKNYQITPDKLQEMKNSDFPPEMADKLKEVGEKRYRTEKDFTNTLSEHLNKEEFEKYEDKLINYFSFFRLGSKIALTLQSANDQLVTPVFRVKGIYKTSNTMFDGMTAFVEKDVLDGYLGLNKNDVHEITIISTDDATGNLLGEKLSSLFPDQSVLSWKKISPELAMYADFGKLMNYFYVVIILLALAFGIINTMMMSVLERVKELGMLMAIGMNKIRVFSMIMLESVFLALSGALAGMLISGVIIAILHEKGLNFGMWAEGFEAIGYASVVYPFITADTFIGITLLVILTGMMASIWPARKALKLNPAEAIRSDM